MTVQEAVREEMREAYHEENRLFAEFCKSMSEPQYALFLRQQLQDAAKKTAQLRTILFGVLEGERIWKERTIQPHTDE